MPPKIQPQKNSKAVPAARPRGPRPQPASNPAALLKKEASKSNLKADLKPKAKTTNTRGKPARKKQTQARPQATSGDYSDVPYETDVKDEDYLVWKEANPRVMPIPDNFIKDSALPFVMKSIEGDDWEEELQVPAAIVKARQKIERLDKMARERGREGGDVGEG